MNTTRNQAERRRPEMKQLSAAEIAATAGGLQLTAAGTSTRDGEIINPFTQEFANWESWNRCDGDCGWD